MEDAAKRRQTAASWLDLQVPIAELILERLPLADYLRFAAVCRKWRSIQRDHRLRYSPRPPPMPQPLPWLVPEDPTFPCYSPFDRKLYSLNLLASAAGHYLCLFSSHGWLAVLTYAGDPQRLFLLNPVSGIQIQIPTVPIGSPLFGLIGALSAPPHDPQCVLLLADHGRNIFLCSINAHSNWAKIPYNIEEFKGPYKSLQSAVYFRGKFYCVSAMLDLYVVDPVLDLPSMKLLEMGFREAPWHAQKYLVESNGDLFLILQVPLCDPQSDLEETGFQAYKADLSSNNWVKVENIGDRVLFVGLGSSFSFSAADVGSKANCIYYLCGPEKAFGIFDLESNSVIYARRFLDSATKEELRFFDRSFLHWVVPTLDYINSAEASDSERVIAKEF